MPGRIAIVSGSLLQHCPDILIGYAGISTLDQNLDLQRATLTKAGCTGTWSFTTGSISSSLPNFLEVDPSHGGMESARDTQRKRVISIAGSEPRPVPVPTPWVVAC